MYCRFLSLNSSTVLTFMANWLPHIQLFRDGDEKGRKHGNVHRATQLWDEKSVA